MIIQVSGGLISRLYVLSTVVKIDGLGREIDTSNLRVVWNSQPGMVAKFTDLFTNDFGLEHEPVDITTIPVKTYGSPSHIILRHLSLNEVQNIGPNNMIWSNQSNDYIVADWPVHINGRSPCEESMSKFLTTLIPTNEIKAVVNKYLKDFSEYTYGINIRRGGTTVNYHTEACHRSPDHLFFNKIREILSIKPECKFVITTDSKPLLDEIVNQFGEDKLIYIRDEKQYPLDCGYSIQGMKRALIDWYLLSKTQFIYRTINTGYSLRLCKAFNIPSQELYV